MMKCKLNRKAKPVFSGQMGDTLCQSKEAVVWSWQTWKAVRKRVLFIIGIEISSQFHKTDQRKSIYSIEHNPGTMDI